jgi:hypothetical protein
VRDDILLIELHHTIQTVMGWWNSHLHRFEIEGKGYQEDAEDDDSTDEDEGTTALRDVLKPSTTTFTYEYDFGDGWPVESVRCGQPISTWSQSAISRTG